MAYLDWREEYSVGIKSIDNQHKMLIGMINDFYNQIKEKSNQELIAVLIRKMKAYTVYHFTAEEKLFAKFNYPQARQHIKKHQSFIAKVDDLESRYVHAHLILSFEITNFLKDWLINHIQVTDMKYTDYLIKRGVK